MRLDAEEEDFLESVERGEWQSVRRGKREQNRVYTALRDILFLVQHGILVHNPGGGRSTSYALSSD